VDLPRRNVGLHPYRLLTSAGNPEEVRFAVAWEKQNEEGHTLDFLLHQGTQNGMPPEASPRDRAVAATIIQWLGSPVGQHFLMDLGYVRTLPAKSKKKR
jgi:hypothetical protein